MTKEEQIAWMEGWCEAQGLKLQLNGTCGFGRECVGVLSADGAAYPDYIWYDKNYDHRLDPNGDVWTPDDAYHKHNCVAVLGASDDAVSQLYEWLKWFSDNGFKYEKVTQKCDNMIELLMGRDWHHRLTKQNSV